MSEKYKWDAQDYRKSSSSQQRWAQELMGKLSLSGTERILDIGCGDGKVTFELSRLVPYGSVIGIDNSEDMIILAQRIYPPDKFSNLRFQVKDARELEFKDEFDIIFSNAALHWIVNHRPVLIGMSKSLRPSGRVLLQMGGRGNACELIYVIERIITHTRWNQYFTGFSFLYRFYGPEEYSIWLKDAGLEAKRIELIPKDMTHLGKEEFASWIRTTWLPYIQRIPKDIRFEFIDQIVEEYIKEHPIDNGFIHVSMMRLEVEAEKIL